MNRDATRNQLQRERATLETELRDAEFIQQLADEACEIRGASNYLRNLVSHFHQHYYKTFSFLFSLIFY